LLAENVANHKQLRGGIRYIEEIPKSAAGKILRRILKERAATDLDNPKPHIPKMEKM